MDPPPLFTVAVPGTATFVANVIGSLVVVRSVSILMVPLPDWAVTALKVDGETVKLTSPLPCALNPRTPVIFWLSVEAIPLALIHPMPVVLRSSPPEVLMRLSSLPVMVNWPDAFVPPR